MHRLEDVICVDLRLQFEWRGSLGWWGVVATSKKGARRVTTLASVGMLTTAEEAMSHADVAEHARKAVKPSHRNTRCRRCKAEGERPRVGDVLRR